MPRSKHIVTFCTALLVCAAPAVQAAEFRYVNPQYKNRALDYCKSWGRNCGAPAADAYCKKLGHHRATRFSVRLNSPPTRVISGGKVCNNWSCDRISAVVCEGGKLKLSGGGDAKADSTTVVADPDVRFSSAEKPDDCE